MLPRGENRMGVILMLGVSAIFFLSFPPLGVAFFLITLFYAFGQQKSKEHEDNADKIYAAHLRGEIEKTDAIAQHNSEVNMGCLWSVVVGFFVLVFIFAVIIGYDKNIVDVHPIENLPKVERPSGVK